MTYGSDDELDSILQRTKNPLTFYVFTNNKKFGKKLINNYSFGGGAINDTIGQIVNKNLPFGGIGNSGMGKISWIRNIQNFQSFQTIHNKV